MSDKESVKKSKKPQRNLIAKPKFNIISGHITIWYIPDLSKPFTFTSNFKQIPVINHEVTVLGKSYLMTDTKKRSERTFSFCAYLRRGKGTHEC